MRGRSRQTLPAALAAVVLVASGCQGVGPEEPAGDPVAVRTDDARRTEAMTVTAEPTPDPVPVFPDENSTGVPDDVTLTPSEALEITEDGTVVDGLHVRGRVVVSADDVVIRNTLVQSGTSLSPIQVTGEASGVLIEDVEVDNLGGTGIGIVLQGSATVRRVDIHSAEDGIRVGADDVTIEDSYIHDLSRMPEGHHDCIQIRSGRNVTIRGNSLQSYVAETDDPMNAAIQIGSLSGDEQIANLLVIGNLMNGGNYTINGGGRDEVESARYSRNRFGHDFRYGVVGNLQNSIWEDTNVWHETGEPVQ